jgi:RecA/RadA recombinase
MSDLLSKLRKNSTIKETDILVDSKFFNKKDMVQTPVPAINVALSGSLTGGLTPGLTTLAGPSRHFKTGFGLLMAKAYMDKYPESVLMFYDSEFGTPKSYFEAFDIDSTRVLHTPLTDIEQLKFDVMTQLDVITRGERVIFLIDSVGNLASKKEVDDAIKQNSAADMTRAKQLKSLFRMITPHLNIKDIPMLVVNHVYMTQEMFSKPVVSGGTGVMYSSDTVFIIGRQQEKDGKELMGYNFIINVEKSRYVKEKSKIPVEVTFEGGISRWGGLLEMAQESGHVIKPKNGWYQRVDMTTGEVADKSYREKDTYKAEFWAPILSCPVFGEYIEKRYQVSHGAIMKSEDTVDDVYSNIAED